MLLLCLLLGGGRAWAGSEYEFSADPEWVRMDALPAAVAANTASDGLRYLLAVDQVNLAGKTPVWNSRVSYQVERERALSSAGQINVYYQPGYQHVAIHALEVWRGGKRFDRRKDSRIEILRRETDLEGASLDGGHTLSITIPDIRVRDRVEYRYSVAGYNPVFGTGYYDVYQARFSEPVSLRHVRFLYPESLALRWSEKNPGLQWREGRDGQLHTLDFSARDLGRVNEDEDAPDSYDPYGKVQVSTAADWKAVASWALPLYVAAFNDSRLESALAKELRLDSNDPEGSMERAIAFVQGDVRYTALDMGQNSHAPNPPDVTARRRFGDCKDKSLLLVALLRQAGIRADPVLVHTDLRKSVQQRLPSPLAFNHVVVRAMTRGRPVWIDPTRDREHGRIGDRSALGFGYGLLISAETDGLVEIPDPMPVQPQVDVSQDIEIKQTGANISARFRVDSEYRQGYGDGIRSNFASNGPNEEGKKYLEYMRGFYDGIDSLNDPALEVNEADNSLRSSEGYLLEWDKDKEGTVFDIALFQLSDWMPKLKHQARTAPFEFGGPRFARQLVRTKLDHGWNIESKTERVNNHYFSFQRKVEVKDGRLEVTGEWRRFASEVAAKDYPDFRRDMEKARELLDFDIELEADSSIFSAKPGDWLWAGMAVALAGILLILAWWKRGASALAGMVFQPGRTSMALLERGSALVQGLLLMVLLALIAAAFEMDWMIGSGPTWHAFGVFIGQAMGFCLRFFLIAALLKLAFRLMRRPVPYRNLLLGATWGNVPGILFFSCLIVAVGGRLHVYGAGYETMVGDLPGMLVGGMMALLAIAWTMFSTISAYAGVSGSTRTRATGAILLATLCALAIVVPLALLTYLFRH